MKVIICLAFFVVAAIAAPTTTELPTTQSEETYKKFHDEVVKELHKVSTSLKELEHEAHAAKSADAKEKVAEKVKVVEKELQQLMERLRTAMKEHHSRHHRDFIRQSEERVHHDLQVVHQLLRHLEPHHHTTTSASVELNIIDEIKKMVVDKIVAFEKELADIAQKFLEYEKTKSPEAKEALIKKIDEELVKLKALEDQIHAEAAKKDNNQIKQWLLEHAETLVKNIETRLKNFEDKLKGGSVELNIVDDIKKLIVDKIVAFEKELADIAQKFLEYEKTKSPEAKEALIKKIDEELVKLKALEDQIHAEAAKKDNNQIKQWLLEHAETLVKNIETRLKSFEEKLKGSTDY